MLVLRGESTTVTLVRYEDQDVWFSGVRTPYGVLHTYMDTVVLHVRGADDVPAWDLRGVYVINSGDRWLNETLVARGAYCLHGTFEQGMWRLRTLLRDYI